MVEVPVDIAIDENPGDHDDAEFQQPNPFRKSMIWHPQEIFHDLELKTGPSKRNEMQVAFCKGLYNRHLAEMKVLVHQLMREQDKSRKKGKGKRNSEGNEKSGAVWRDCAYAYWHFHFVKDKGQEFPKGIVNIEDDGKCGKEPFCLRSAHLPPALSH